MLAREDRQLPARSLIVFNMQPYGLMSRPIEVGEAGMIVSLRPNERCFIPDKIPGCGPVGCGSCQRKCTNAMAQTEFVPRRYRRGAVQSSSLFAPQSRGADYIIIYSRRGDENRPLDSQAESLLCPAAP